MKQCTKCKEWKEESGFSKNKNKRDGLQDQCKQCCKEYKQNNKEKIKKCNRIYKEKHKEQLLKYNRIYKEKYKEQLLKYGKIYNKSNAKYEVFNSRLTIDESPRLAEDGVSLEVKCRYCGRYFIPTNSQVKNRINALGGIRKGDCGMYCSEGCKKTCPIYNQTKWPKGFKPATSREVQPELRKLVLLRDDYTCQKCGKFENIQLHCHHIWPLNESPVTSADVDECVTLCKDCHKLTHKIPGCGLYELRCSKEIKL